MKKNLTKIIMMALCLCMMIAVFTVVTSAEEAPINLKNAEVTLNKYYSFYDGNEPDMPTVTVEVGDKVLTEGTDYDLVIEHSEGSEIGEPGRYIVKVEANSESTLYTGESAEVYYFVIGRKNGTVVIGNPSKIYDGEAAVIYFSAEEAGGDDYFRNNGKGALKVIEYCTIDEDGVATSKYTTTAPVAAGNYRVRVMAIRKGYYAVAEKDYTIAPKGVYLPEGAVVEKVYGTEDKDADFSACKIVDNGFEVTLVFKRNENHIGENAGSYKMDVKSSNPNYVVLPKSPDTKPMVDLEILPKKVTLSYDATLVYNGEIQLPAVKLDGVVNAADAYDFEIVGGARKYAGTYTATVVLGNENYYIESGEEEIVYTIVENADGAGDREAAVDKFVGIVDSITNNVEVAAPVVEVITNVGNAIWGGIKSGFQALISDFFGRVFG